MKYLFGATLALVFSSTHAQYKAEEFEAALLPARYGALLVFNGTSNSFSLKFEGDSIQPMQARNFLTIDGILKQASLVPFNQDIGFGDLDEGKQKKWLQGWRQYEKSWAEEQLKQKLEDQAQFSFIGGRHFLIWSYQMPKSEKKGSVNNQVFVAGICFDQILVLNAPVTQELTVDQVTQKLKTIADTVTLFPGQVQNLEQLYKQLAK